MSDDLKVGVMLPLGSGEMDRVVTTAQEAESLGFDGVFAYDHFFAPGTSPAHPVPECLTTLAVVGANTSRVALGTLVLRVGVREPAMLAKMAAQLDDQTGGRCILGLGAGDEFGRPELGTYGIPDRETQEERWVLLQETVGVCRALFDGGIWPGGQLTPHVAGPLVPAPHRPHGPPIWVGGMSSASRVVAATQADGWNAWGVPEEVFLDRTVRLQREAAEAGRTCVATWAGVTMVGADDDDVTAMLAARRDAGMSEDGLWVGTAEDLTGFASRMSAGGAAWIIVAPSSKGTKLTAIAGALGRGPT